MLASVDVGFAWNDSVVLDREHPALLWEAPERFAARDPDCGLEKGYGEQWPPPCTDCWIYVDSFHANSVVPGTFPPPTGPHPDHTYTPQRFRLNADNPCHGSGPGCPQDAPVCEAPTYTFLTVAGRRTAGSGASCAFAREDEPSSEIAPSGLRSYFGTWGWTEEDARADGRFYGPRLTNKCAGAYDVVVRIRNEDYGGAVTSASEPYRQSRSFHVRRPSRLTVNAGAPVPVGGTVTIRGRLTRTDWDRATDPQAGYAGQRVLLQRATSPWGIYHTLRTVRTDGRGYLRIRIEALSGTRCYRWVFHTNATTQRGVSAAGCAPAR